MKIRNKKVAFWYAVVIGGYILLFIGCVIYQLNQPYTGERYYLQEGE